MQSRRIGSERSLIIEAHRLTRRRADRERIMTIPWQPMEPDHRDGGGPQPPEDLAAWAELFATTIAHLAAQLTMTQLRLRLRRGEGPAIVRECEALAQAGYSLLNEIWAKG